MQRLGLAALPRGVESVDESSGNVGDGQDEDVAYRKSPPAHQMFLEQPAPAAIAPRRLRLEPQSQPKIRMGGFSISTLELFPLTNSTY